MSGLFLCGHPVARVASKLFSPQPVLGKILDYVFSIAGVFAMTGLIALIPNADHTANVSLLYLLIVIGAAHRFGRGPAVLTSLLAVLAFNWFFVEPRHTFTVTDPAEWLVLMVFLVISMVISQLTTKLRLHAQEARNREQETAALAQASWAVASQVSHHQALSEVLRRLTDVVGSEVVAIVAPSQNGELEIIATYGASPHTKAALPDFTMGATGALVKSIFQQGQDIGWAELGCSQEGVDGYDKHQRTAPVQRNTAYLSLGLNNRVLGVLYLRLHPDQLLSLAERRVIESLSHHAAVSLERDRLTRAETASQALAEADRLKTALLSMISHDFRSPLTSIKTSVTGLLQEGRPWEAHAQRELLVGQTARALP